MDIQWFQARKKEVGAKDQDVADAIGIERSVANKILNGKVGFDLRYVDGLAASLRVDRAEILRRAGVLRDDTGGGGSEIPEGNARPVRLQGASLQRSRENLPVYGTGLGSAVEIEGEAIEQTTLNKGETVEYAVRPAILNRRPDAYGLYVQGGSMHPALPDGEMVAVSPKMPLAVGDNVVVYLRTDRPEDDDGQAARAVLVKELVRRTANYVELRQYQPPKDFRIPMAEVLRIDRVLTRREMMS